MVTTVPPAYCILHGRLIPLRAEDQFFAVLNGFRQRNGVKTVQTFVVNGVPFLIKNVLHTPAPGGALLEHRLRQAPRAEKIQIGFVLDGLVLRQAVVKHHHVVGQGDVFQIHAHFALAVLGDVALHLVAQGKPSRYALDAVGAFKEISFKAVEVADGFPVAEGHMDGGERFFRQGGGQEQQGQQSGRQKQHPQFPGRLIFHLEEPPC